MDTEKIVKIVMDNMPQHEGSRREVVEYVDGVDVTYRRPYSPKWGFGGWRAEKVAVNGVEIAIDDEWVRLV